VRLCVTVANSNKQTCCRVDRRPKILTDRLYARRRSTRRAHTHRAPDRELIRLHKHCTLYALHAHGQTAGGRVDPPCVGFCASVRNSDNNVLNRLVGLTRNSHRRFIYDKERAHANTHAQGTDPLTNKKHYTRPWTDLQRRKRRSHTCWT